MATRPIVPRGDGEGSIGTSAKKWGGVFTEEINNMPVDSLGGLSVGFITALTQSTAPDGWLLCNGAEVSRATYPDLWDYIKNTSMVLTEADWQSKNTAGEKNIGWYSSGDGTTTFRLPRIVGSGELTEVKRFATAGAGSFTAPVTGIYRITLQGAGGGGAGASGINSGKKGSGGGGGQGGRLEVYESLTAGTTYSFTIGAGGAGGATDTSDTGGNGGATSITVNSNAYVANGGDAGNPIKTRGGFGGDGGKTTINGITTTAVGASGCPCVLSFNSTNWYAPGGSGGGQGGKSLVAASYGGGGCGGNVNDNGTYNTGSAGGDGYIEFAFNPVPQYWYVRAFGSATNQGTIDITALANLVNTKLDITTFENIFPISSESHSRIFRGKEITESWASLRERIAQGNFTDLYIGDYKTITLTGGETVVMEVAGIDQYYNCGDTAIGHHVDFISRDCLAGGKRMNATNTNNGTSAEKHPWLASELYTTLNDETNGVYAKLPSDLKPYIITKRALLEERYSAGGAVSADTSWSWADAGKLWLPTEVEVFGHHAWSEPGYGTGGNLQYQIFTGGAKHIIKGDGNGGSRCPWWELSADRMNATNFCDVYTFGYCRTHDASNTGLRAPLCFRIG